MRSLPLRVTWPVPSRLRARGIATALARPAERSTSQLAFDFDAAPRVANDAVGAVVATITPPALAPMAVPLPVVTSAPVARASDDSAHEAALAAITQAIHDATRVPIEVVLTDNRRTMISTQRRDDTLVVRLHRMFLRAGPTVVHALARYLSRRDARASRLVGEFIEAHRSHVHSQRPRALRSAGHHHDLRALFDEVNAAEFAGAITGVSITWGKHGTSKRRRRSIRLGTYTRSEQLVRIHPALDAAWVPRFFVRYIVFHELLHHVEPEIEHAGRTEFHTPRFRARERAYVDYRRALTWERENIGRLLRARAPLET